MLSKLLDVASLRHRVIAQNVANVNTPDYRQQEVVFEDAFARALGREGDAIAAAVGIQPKVIEGTGAAERWDGNNVDIDVEMGQLTKNTLLFRTFAQILTAELATMRTAISGPRPG